MHNSLLCAWANICNKSIQIVEIKVPRESGLHAGRVRKHNLTLAHKLAWIHTVLLHTQVQNSAKFNHISNMDASVSLGIYSQWSSLVDAIKLLKTVMIHFSWWYWIFLDSAPVLYLDPSSEYTRARRDSPPSYGAPAPSYPAPAPSYHHAPPGRVGPVYTFVKTDYEVRQYELGPKYVTYFLVELFLSI